jgi:hypothetical protein
MNLREGTRRLALLLGVAGAIVGGFASYSEFQTVLSQRADYQRFEQLANSDLVQEAKHWITLAPEQRVKTLALMTPEHKAKLAKALGFNGTPKQYLDDSGKPIAAPSKTYLDDNGNPISDQTTSSDVGEINKDGIKTIRWTSDHKVESLETQDGQTLYSVPRPGAWAYAAIALLPLLGFFIPWGTARALGWVLAGFVAGSK